MAEKQLRPLQEALNHIVAAMRKQGKPSMDGDTGCCRYTSDDGCHCAVGCLLPVDVDLGTLEGSPVRDIRVRRLLVEEGWLSSPYNIDRIEFFAAMQFAHDAYAKRENWLELFESEARRVARQFDLQYPA